MLKKSLYIKTKIIKIKESYLLLSSYYPLDTMYHRSRIEKESFAERDTQTPVDGPCMSLVHLTEMKGDRNSDGKINRLSAGSSKKERGGGRKGKRDRERERVYWFEGPTMPSFRLRIHGRIIEFSRL